MIHAYVNVWVNFEQDIQVCSRRNLDRAEATFQQIPNYSISQSVTAIFQHYTRGVVCFQLTTLPLVNEERSQTLADVVQTTDVFVDAVILTAARPP